MNAATKASTAASLAALLALASATSAHALTVFAGDPVNASTGLAQPMMPGLPLLLPGPDGTFGNADDVHDNAIHGDVDLVARAGSITVDAIPAPAGAAGGPAAIHVVAGGGVTGQGSEAPFTVLLSDGSGAPPYGNAITNSELDGRPVAVYAFADLDGDGFVGPTVAGMAASSAVQEQESTAYTGRQVGVFAHGRLHATLGLEVAAPESIGGLDTVLVAGAYTGNNGSVLFSDGTLVLTRWPFFPPLDPNKVLDLTSPHTPDPAFPSALDFDLGEQYLPPPDDAYLGNAFALPTSGSEPTIDHVVVRSGPADSAAFFVDVASAGFRARQSTSLRVAPPASGPGRALVLSPDRIVLAEPSGQHLLRVLPVDRLSNVADLSAPKPLTVRVRGEIAIVSPDTDSDTTTEALTLADARGATLIVASTGNDGGRVEILDGTSVVASLPVVSGAATDSDGDGIVDDGSGSGVAGDRPCDGDTASCDDNCPSTVNPSQLDSDRNGIGDCCDGTCLAHPSLPGCAECAVPGFSTEPVVSDVRVRVRLGSGGTPDSIAMRLIFTLPDAASDVPDAMHAAVALTQAGRGGYHADVASIPRDLARSEPWYEVGSTAGVAAGEVAMQVRQRAGNQFTGAVHARGDSIVDLGAGAAALTIYLAGEPTFDTDDLVNAGLQCTATARAVHCKAR